MHRSIGNDSGSTILEVMCAKGNLRVVELLVKRGADPTTHDAHGWTPFMMACFYGKADVVQYLVNNPVVLAKIDAVEDKGKTALWLSCYQGHATTLRVLLRAGADPMITDESGHSPMDMAKRWGKTECVQLLEVSGVGGGSSSRSTSNTSSSSSSSSGSSSSSRSRSRSSIMMMIMVSWLLG